MVLTVACGVNETQIGVAPTAVPARPTVTPAASGGAERAVAAQNGDATADGATNVVTSTAKPSVQAEPSDVGDLGSNAYYYLNRVVPKIQIEIDAVKGYEPSRSAVGLLVQRLKSVADKPAGIDVLPYGTVPARDVWSVGDLRKADEKYRNYHSSSDVVVIHILYVNGDSKEGALGVAFSSGGCALFIQKIRDGALPTVPAESVEKADIVHEVGHLLSLVNIGYISPRDHEDSDHPAHSDNIESVMYFEIDTEGVFALFRGLNTQPPTDFDADDRADLRDVRDGRLIYDG